MNAFSVLHECHGERIDERTVEWRCIEDGCGYVRRFKPDGPHEIVNRGNYDPFNTTHAGSMGGLAIGAVSIKED